MDEQNTSIAAVFSIVKLTCLVQIPVGYIVRFIIDLIIVPSLHNPGVA